MSSGAKLFWKVNIKNLPHEHYTSVILNVWLYMRIVNDIHDLAQAQLTELPTVLIIHQGRAQHRVNQSAAVSLPYSYKTFWKQPVDEDADWRLIGNLAKYVQVVLNCWLVSHTNKLQILIEIFTSSFFTSVACNRKNK